MEAASLKKRMGRMSRDFHRRMDSDPRLDGISAKLDGIESSLADIKRDFLVMNVPSVEEFNNKQEKHEAVIKKTVRKPSKK